MSDTDDEDYGLAEIVELDEMEAPQLPYQPDDPDQYNPNIGIIGVGGISEQHLKAYTKAGYSVVALCSRTRAKSEEKREEFDLDADIYTEYQDILDRDDIEVVDLLPHPVQREEIIRDALQAGKHILSQKPFTIDIDFGERMAELAEEKGLAFAINQNGRWAPHWSYARHAVEAGLIGQPHGVHFNVNWNHNWIGETEIDAVEHAILYDFAIHWFDILTCIMGEREPISVYASYEPSPSQQATPPLLANAMVEYEAAQASLCFNADTKLGPEDRTIIAGTEGTIKCEGPDLETQDVTIYTGDGYGTPELEGQWFPDGFHGTMAELLSAIEEDRAPYNSARNNLRSLELCFAAVASAEDNEPKVPGDVRRMRGFDPAE